jgi:NADPH:quinone reductase-like Zn-dependent oxidoreductase
MRAVRLHKPGGPEALSYEEVADPQPAPGVAVVRLRAAAVNHRDTYIRRGLQLSDTLPLILGSDGAGVVEAVGEGAPQRPTRG